MLTLNDGRPELWQWDTGRTLSVDADCSQVHFSNKVFGRSIDVDVIDGVATIPDILLQTDKEITAWAFVGTAENGYTKISKVFKVNRRNKPADYVFTPPEQTTLQELVERLAAIEESQDPDAIKNAVEDYLEQNPVEAPVQSVNGKTGSVKLTSEDVGAISQDKLQEATNEALSQAKASGDFDGEDGYTPVKGIDYFTDEDKTEIAEMAAELVEVPDSGQNPDLTGAVQTVNGQVPDENGNVEIGFSVGTGYLNNTAAGLLVSILQTAMFTTDQSANIDALKNALALKDISGTTGSGGSGGSGVGGDASVGFTWVCGTTENNGDWSANNAENRTRMTPYKTSGVFKTKIITDANARYIFDGDFRGQLYLSVIPSGATTMTVESTTVNEFIPSLRIAPALFSADGIRIADPGYGVTPIDLTQYPDAVYYGANIKKTGAFTAEDYTWLQEYLTDFVFT